MSYWAIVTVTRGELFDYYCVSVVAMLDYDYVGAFYDVLNYMIA
jgi:hypothetical protein